MNRIIHQGYKPSPLGPIPEDWEVKRLGCTFHLQGGFAFKSEEYKDSGIPIIRISNLPQNGKYVDINDCVYSDRYDISKQFHIGCDDLLIAMSGATTGKVAVYKDKNSAYLNQRVGLFKQTSSDITYQYLTFLVTSDMYSNQLKPLLIAGAQPNIAPADIENLRFPIPQIKEQERICNVLQLWDTAIEKQTALIEKLTLRKRGLMQQLLTGKKRLKGFGGEWKEVRLKEIGVFFKGSGVPKDCIIDKGHKCLTYGDLYTKYDYVISNVNSFIDDDTADISTQIQYGDICFAGSGETKEDIGKCAAFIDDKIGYAGGDIIVFRANGHNSITLSYLLNSDNAIRQKSSMGQGHSVVHIYPYQLEKLTIRIPSKKEQDTIASILTEADKEIEIQKQKLAAMQAQKKGLMQVLLSGKKRIKLT